MTTSTARHGFARVLAGFASLLMAFTPQMVEASIAYGSINNFDTVNDTGKECHGFEIELDDCHSTDVTYTYNYNHYGAPEITEDNTDPAHPKVFIRWQSKKNPDGSWAAYTAIPSGPIAPTNGHMFTNPSVNFGGEHFGVGYRTPPSAVKYNWLVDNGAGTLIHGGEVQVSTPTFTYFPAAGAAPAQVQAVIVPPVPPAPPVKQFGKAVWVKEIKTTTHNSNKVKLRELVSDDPNDANDKNWRNGEPDEIEVEWRILQKKTAGGGVNDELAAAPEDLPGGNEVVTRRYEFYKYVGPLDAETGEAMGDAVGPDGIHGSGTVTYADHMVAGEWVTVTTDMSTKVVVGDYTGAQMAAVDVDEPVGLIDHVGDGQVNKPFAARSVVVEGALPFVCVQSGTIPPGMTFDDVTGVLSGTPTTAGEYQFTIMASDLVNPDVSKNYTMAIAAQGAALPPASLVDTAPSPIDGGTTIGDGSYDVGADATVTATPADGFVFLNWTDNGQVVSSNASYTLTMDVNHSLVANFAAAAVMRTITTASAPVAGGTTTGGGVVADGDSVTVTATPNQGYSFVNWTEGGAPVSASASYTFTAAADRDLVANFTLASNYVVTTSATPSIGGTTSGGGSFASGSSVTVTASPNAGYNFVNWTENGTQVSASASYTFTIAASRVLVANFVIIGGTQRMIATSSSPAAGGTTSGGGSYADGTSATVTATANPGYKFSKWKENGSNVSSSASYTFTVSADRTLVASFSQAYVVTCTSNPSQGGTTEADSPSYNPGDGGNVKAFPASGYQFVNWTENGVEVSTSTTYNFSNIQANHSYVANFMPTGGVVISTSAAPAAGGTTSGGGGYGIGNSVTVSATPNAGYAFTNWTDGATVVSNSASYTFTASVNRTLVANFAQGYNVGTSVFPSLAGTATGGGLVNPGDSTTIDVTTNPGYTFLNWKDSLGNVVSTSTSYTFTPTASETYTANFSAPVQALTFDFDTSAPLLMADLPVPFDQTKAGYTASFASPDAGGFVVKTEAATGRVLPTFSGYYLESVVDGASLEVTLDQSVTGISFDFATVEALDVPVASTVQLTAIDNSGAAPVVVGTAIAHGSVVAGDSLPVGNLSFNSASPFDQVIIQLVDPVAGAPRVLVDNVVVSPDGSTGGAMTLANPNWNITLSDFGYSDFLLDNTPGFEGREYLSGEWGSAVAYTRNGTPHVPTWLEPNFLYPDWQTNSDFHVVTGIHFVGLNLDGLPIAESVISNDDLEITLRFEMVDTVVGTPMGITPASSAGAPVSVDSNRYVMNQSFTVKNVSGTTITNLQLFQLLHGFISQHGQYDNRTYPGKLGEYQYDVTMAGVDDSAAGADSSSVGLEDLIGFHAKTAPTAFELGYYGIEGNGIDDHNVGKPSDGVHLSVEDNWQHAPYAGRQGRDNFAPPTRWIAGAQRWDLGSLAPDQTVSMDIVLSLLTGTKVVVTGGGSNGTGGGGSCNGGSGHVGGVDFEFDDIDQEGTFFGSYSEADDDELAEREGDGEFALPSFETPNGTRRQLWKLNYSGAHTGGIKLKFAYNPALLPPGYDENQLVIYHFHNGVWEKLNCKVDAAHNIIEAFTPSLSPFMLGVNDVVVTPQVGLSQVAPGSLSVSWPDSFTGWILQESPDLNPSSWFNSTRPVTTADGTSSVTVPTSSGSRFFRLVRP
ncbi:putative Ig domain-containing protein [Prosthecobacter sp.]|uniref:InlB B-repeat-containing protein n=1 Tax=Prosthecobacter sp. TaxID=1965333 RepID=UPI001DD6CE95|nr:putative Ig domain-containing protein [Prosthecobacter sp.]MCB1279182.1 putative Ig domain-containing protein [Prosthecobacter sp.]